jgi:acetyltransferase
MPFLMPRAARRFSPSGLFHPASVVVLGANQAGAQILANIRAGGFAGAVHAVADPAALAALPEAPDLAVLAVAEDALAAALDGLAGRGCYAGIVPGAGRDLAALAAASGVRLLGPGSFGLAVPGIGLNASLGHRPPRPGRLALVSQSSALCRAVIDWAEPNGVGFSHIVGIGGNADLGFATALDWLSRDAGTGAILLDIRRLKDRRAFLSAARAASRLRPVVALRAGGRLIDDTGTADAVMQAALHRAGVLCVASLEEMLAAATTLTRGRPLRSERLAIVTNALGPGRLAADAALREGIALAALAPETRLALQVAVGEGIETDAEPIHVLPDQSIRMAEVAASLSAAGEVGGVLVVHAPVGVHDMAVMDALAASAASMRVPLLVCAMGEATGAAHRARLAEAKLAVFALPEQAVRGFLQLVQQRRARAAARELPPRMVLPLGPDRAAVQRAFAAIRRDGHTLLVQDEALAIFAAYGVPVARSRRAANPTAAAIAAGALGYPVVLRPRRQARPDEAGYGTLFLDLADPAAVRRAAELLAPHAPDGLLVQKQVGRARELCIRLLDDPVFGPALRFGQGGTAAEIIADFAFDLPPLNLALAQGLIARTRAARLLGGTRDLPRADAQAVAETLVRVSQLVVDFPEIAGFDINPLFVGGDGVLAADGWIALRPEGAAGTLAIAPYPEELGEAWEQDGERLLIRPIRPEDAEAHAALFASLSPEDVRMRFFSAIRELAPEQIARMTQVDYQREIAFIAVRESQAADGTARAETLGVSRLVREPPGTGGEFAVLVRGDMKGRGLATRLMRKLIDWGRGQGMTEISGRILAENEAMLAFGRRLGFQLRRAPDEPEVMQAWLPLDPLLPQAPA